MPEFLRTRDLMARGPLTMDSRDSKYWMTCKGVASGGNGLRGGRRVSAGCPLASEGGLDWFASGHPLMLGCGSSSIRSLSDVAWVVDDVRSNHMPGSTYLLIVGTDLQPVLSPCYMCPDVDKVRI